MKKLIVVAIVLCLIFGVLLIKSFSTKHTDSYEDGNTVVIDRGSIKIYFSPNGGAERAVISAIRSARKTIDVAMYMFTNEYIASELVNAMRRGVLVRVIMDEENNQLKYGKYMFLKRSGVPLRVYEGEGNMGNKFAIIDSVVLITGSFNWTLYAEKYNYENLLIIDSPEVARIYEDYFTKMWNKFR